MTPEAWQAVARAFEEILGRRHPGVSFSVPDLSTQPETPARPRQVRRALAPPQDQHPFPDRDAAAADEHSVKASVQ
jgi:hypothetical protein